MIKRFTVYRKGDISETHSELLRNAPDQPQFEGVVFSDGTCALRWLTPLRSTSVWNSLEDALGVHGHFEPRYGTYIVWHDDSIKWKPIETAPKDNARPLVLAKFNEKGELVCIDYDGSWEREQESWEIPEWYYFWASANGYVEEPTHWAFQDEPIPPLSLG